MLQNFKRDDLALAVEDGFGVKIRKMQKIGIGAQSINYILITEDGDKFIVKVVPTIENAHRIISNCRTIESINAVRCLFDGKIVPFSGNSVLCLSYCEGHSVRFEEYDLKRIDELIFAYNQMSYCIQNASEPHPRFALTAEKESLRVRAEAMSRRNIYLSVLDELSSEEVYSFEEEKPCVIHGDFHFANFRYNENSVSGIFDFMEFRLGHPTEDFVRLVLCSAERLRWYRFSKRGSMLKMFAYLVSKTGYSYAQWAKAIDGYLIHKLIKYANKGKRGLLFSVKIRMRLRLYRQLKAIARCSANLNSAVDC